LCSPSLAAIFVVLKIAFKRNFNSLKEKISLCFELLKEILVL